MFRYKVDDREAQKLLRNLITRFSTLNKETSFIQRRVSRDLQSHFDKTIDPRGSTWQILSPSWAKKKARLRPNEKILSFDKYLQKSITSPSAMSKWVNPRGVMFSWSSYLPYARVHNWGGQAGHSIMPKREYGYISPEALNHIAVFIMRGI